MFYSFSYLGTVLNQQALTQTEELCLATQQHIIL